MASASKGMKVFVIVLNIVIWAYVAYIILPLVFGDSSSPPKKRRVVAQGSRKRTMPVRPANSKNNSNPHSQSRSSRWLVKKPLAFYASAKDPFVPFLYPRERKTAPARKVNKVKKVINYTIPTDRQRRPEPITILYRLSSIVKLQAKSFAIVNKGGANSSGINVEVGSVLPGGGIVKEINFGKKFIIVEKKGHLFKLVDHSPWISKIR